MNHSPLSRATNSPLYREQPIDMAVASTQVTAFQMLKGLAHALAQISGLEELQIARFKIGAGKLSICAI